MFTYPSKLVFFFLGICLPSDLADYFSCCRTDAKLKEKSKLVEALVRTEVSNSVIPNAQQDKVSQKNTLVKHNETNCLVCCRKYAKDILYYSQNTTKKQSAESKRVLIELDNDSNDRYWNFIIKHIKRIANPVWSKQSKHKLLDLKQRYSYSFQNVCLYSEVSNILGCFSFRPSARRFIQEIFYDIDFTSSLHAFSKISMNKDLFSEKLTNFENTLNFEINSDKSLRNICQELTMNLSDNTIFSEQQKTKFHTLELDLSCTKNKFPIRTRKFKMINQNKQDD